jgi:hypothetical protein
VPAIFSWAHLDPRGEARSQFAAELPVLYTKGRRREPPWFAFRKRRRPRNPSASYNQNLMWISFIAVILSGVCVTAVTAISCSHTMCYKIPVAKLIEAFFLARKSGLSVNGLSNLQYVNRELVKRKTAQRRMCLFLRPSAKSGFSFITVNVI